MRDPHRVLAPGLSIACVISFRPYSGTTEASRSHAPTVAQLRAAPTDASTSSGGPDHTLARGTGDQARHGPPSYP